MTLPTITITTQQQAAHRANNLAVRHNGAMSNLEKDIKDQWAQWWAADTPMAELQSALDQTASQAMTYNGQSSNSWVAQYTDALTLIALLIARDPNAFSSGRYEGTTTFTKNEDGSYSPVAGVTSKDPLGNFIREFQTAGWYWEPSVANACGQLLTGPITNWVSMPTS